jgi:hypothetical protein
MEHHEVDINDKKKDNHGFVVALISHDTKESVPFQMANKEQ